MGEVERNFEMVYKLLLQLEKSKMVIFRMYGPQCVFQLSHILYGSSRAREHMQLFHVPANLESIFIETTAIWTKTFKSNALYSSNLPRLLLIPPTLLHANQVLLRLCSGIWLAVVRHSSQRKCLNERLPHSLWHFPR